jgi:RNA polymerase sigma-70 factor (ECF subfamily)
MPQPSPWLFTGKRSPSDTPAQPLTPPNEPLSPPPTSTHPAPLPTQEWFAQAFHQHYRVLWWIAVGIVNDRALAEDVVQEAALQALLKLDQFKPGTDFAAWLGQVVRFVALNQARKRRHRAAQPYEEAAPDAPHTSHDAPSPAQAESSLMRSQRGELPESQTWFDDQLVHALAQVTQTARACLLLRTLEGLSYEEIAQVMGIAPGTAMSHVHRTRLALRRNLGLPSELPPSATPQPDPRKPRTPSPKAHQP